MNPGTIGIYKKPGKQDELRIHFPAWELDGEIIPDVTVFPHLCGTCIGGDHTHVEIHDNRAPFMIIAENAVVLSDEHKKVIDDYLRAAIRVHAITQELAKYLGTHHSARPKLFSDLLGKT